MAGGEHAKVVPCIFCGGRGERTHEGIEDDQYLCENGHGFGIDWSHSGPPKTPRWPMTAQERTQFDEMLRLLGRLPPK